MPPWTRILLTGLLLVGALQASAGEGVPDAILRLGRSTVWRQVLAVPLEFDAGHPQGLVRRGQGYWLSSVAVEVAPKRFPSPDPSGFDRDPGTGTGRIFHFDDHGRLLASARIGEGTRYHPGGMDFDGRDLWVPVAEYRPGGHSSILRVDPKTLRSSVAFEVADHVGAVAVDPASGRVFGASWGSRTFYTWDLQGNEMSRLSNPSHYVDLQDWKYLGNDRVLGGGIAEFAGQSLGGLELWDVRGWRPLHLVPVIPRTDRDVVLTRNPLAVEVVGESLRIHVVPEDGQTRVLVFEAQD